MQLAALLARGQDDAAGLIRAFSGGHRFVLDYLVEEVLNRQTPDVAGFLLRSSILDRMSGPLCDAGDSRSRAAGPGDARAARAGEPVHRGARRGAALVSIPPSLSRPAAPATRAGRSASVIDELHGRASRWYGERFRARGLRARGGRSRLRPGRVADPGQGRATHAGRARPSSPGCRRCPRRPSRLARRCGFCMRWCFWGAGAPPESPRSSTPRTWIWPIGRTKPVRATSVARSPRRAHCWRSPSIGPTRWLRVAQRALTLLRPDDLPTRASVIGTLGYAYEVLGDRARSRKAYGDAFAISQATGSRFGELVASRGTAAIQELDNELRLAAGTYEDTIQLAVDLPYPVISELHLLAGCLPAGNRYCYMCKDATITLNPVNVLIDNLQILIFKKNLIIMILGGLCSLRFKNYETFNQ